MSGNGQLSAAAEQLGAGGTATFTQSGGTNSISGPLYLGYASGGKATYVLSGAGQLSAPTEYVGYNSAATASFQQTGGTNSTNYLTISSGNTYQLAGGTLQISNDGLVDQGTFDGAERAN